VKKLRGQSIKQENLHEITIDRNFLTKNYQLHLNKDACNGCGICYELCPHEAIKIQPSTVFEGKLLERPTIDIDEDVCILCGECAVLCPLNALTMKLDGQENSTIIENEAFPELLKEIIICKEKCDPECELVCQKECPTEAIKISTKKSENGKIEITNIEVDESSCLYCKRCELACNQNAISVKKPFKGRIKLNENICPDGCVACADICPSHAIEIVNGKPKVTKEFCIFCSACERICPKEAIKVERDWIFHTEIKAAAWLTALKKLTSCETVAKELRIKSVKRRTNVVKAREASFHRKFNPSSCNQAEEFLKILIKCKK
jgi:4Fe-4S ferredoxin